MCGIIGIVQTPTLSVTQDLVDALKRLEYRGYDSAGVAVIHDHAIHQRRAAGKLEQLIALLKADPIQGSCGIGHTRWATHGAPTVDNAHPHSTHHVAVVHNGIIENYQELKALLADKGYPCTTPTDTEVVAQWITYYMDQGLTFEDAIKTTLPILKGAYALALISPSMPQHLYFARHGSPLVIGHGQDAFYVGSDAIALASLTPHVTYPLDGDWGFITPTEAVIYDSAHQKVERPLHTLNLTHHATDKGTYRHFMEKEIFEQPAVLETTLAYYATRHDLPFDPRQLTRLTLVACGTSFYAAWVGKYWIEKLTGLAVDIDIASEFRYREPALGTPQNHGLVVISQSGETVDTLAALRYGAQHGLPTLAIVNVTHSAIAREADAVWPTFAGPEIGVASTKAFTCQMMVVLHLALRLAQERGTLTPEQVMAHKATLTGVPAILRSLSTLSLSTLRATCYDVGRKLHNAQDVLFLGRGSSYPMALEGALKLKEISYIHAEGYAAGELKHGPIALIDDGMPVVVLMPSDSFFEKTLSNVQEVLARGAHVIAIGDAQSLEHLSHAQNKGDLASKPSALSHPQCTFVVVPKVEALAQPFVQALPLQLIAYETAVQKGTDVDQPRNLAKSVTVE